MTRSGPSPGSRRCCRDRAAATRASSDHVRVEDPDDGELQEHNYDAYLFDQSLRKQARSTITSLAPARGFKEGWVSILDISETGRISFRGARFQTPNSVSFIGLTEFRGANSVSSFQPIICV